MKTYTEKQVRALIETLCGDAVSSDSLAQTVEATLLACEQSVADANRSIENTRSELQQLELQLREKMTEKVRLDADLAALQHDVKVFGANMEDFSVTKQNCVTAIESCEREIERKSTQIEKLHKDVASSSGELKQAVAALDSERSRMEPLLQLEREAFLRWEVREKSKEEEEGPRTSDWEARLQQVVQAKEEFMNFVFPPSILNELLSKMHLVESDLQSLKSSLDCAEKSKRADEESREKQKEHLKELEQRIGALKFEIESVQDQLSVKKSELGGVQSAVDSLGDRVEKCNRQVSHSHSLIEIAWTNCGEAIDGLRMAQPSTQQEK